MQERKGTTLVAELMRTQRATRWYSRQAIAEEDIRAILNARLQAQSANNRQAWYFLVVREQARLHLLAECGRSTDQSGRATFAIALVTPRTGTEDDFDLGQAAAYLQLAAWELGISSCIGWVHSPEKAREALHLPADLSCPVILSFGYPASQQKSHLPKKRKPFDAVVRWEQWS